VCYSQLLSQRYNLRLALCQLSLVLLQRHLQLAGNLQAARRTGSSTISSSNIAGGGGV
jgi:hypothetical protein